MSAIQEVATEIADTVNKSQKEMIQEVPPQDPPEVEMAELKKEVKTALSSFDSANITSAWSNLLGNIDSIPTRSLFSDHARPAEISPEKIVLFFANDMHLKLAQGKAKIAPFEKAALKLFGRAPNIIFKQGKLEETSNSLSKKHSVPAPVISQPAKKENFEQISQDFEEIQKKQMPKVIVAEEQQPAIDEEIIEEIKVIEKSVQQVNISETAKIVKDLFQGKVID
jgi:hypothetical protein